MIDIQAKFGGSEANLNGLSHGLSHAMPTCSHVIPCPFRLGIDINLNISKFGVFFMCYIKTL